jgi:anti-sigma-K factor RskA
MENAANPNDDAPRMTAKIIPVSPWLSYIVAACLMSLGILQTLQILDLKSQLAITRADATRLQESNALIGLRLTTLAVKDASYVTSEIAVAWDSYQHRGVISLQNLPTAPAGHDYQLWVLDPTAETPISAGVLTSSRSFEMKPLGTQNPGFAISLEPTGGSPVLTGPILFAVAPGP